MRSRLAVILLVFCLSALANTKFQGYAERGGAVVVTSAVNSTTKVQQSFPGATVTVRNLFDNSVATIYSNSTGTALANPFVADSTGYWSFFASDGISDATCGATYCGSYSVTFSGLGVASPYTWASLTSFDPKDLPFTISDQLYLQTGRTFYQACVAAAAASRTLLVSGSWTAMATGSCAANLVFYKGGVLQPASAQTVTLTGSLTAPPLQIFDVSLGSGAKVTGFKSPEVYSEWWGAATDGSTVDDTAINAALVMAANGAPFHVLKTSAVHNVILPTAASVKYRIVFDPGVQWNCTAADGTDCVAGITTAFSNQFITIEGMTLVGPDPTTSTHTSGNGLRISGNYTNTTAAVPFITLTRFSGKYFRGTACAPTGEVSGCAALWTGGGGATYGPEDGTFTNVFTSESTIGWRADGAFNANTINSGASTLNDTYGFYCFSCSSNTFNAYVVQSNVLRGMFMAGFGQNSMNSLHLEANNTANSAALCTFTVDATSGSGSSVGNVFNGMVAVGTHDKMCFTNTGSTNALNRISGGSFSSLSGGITITAAPQQIFESSFAPSAVTGAGDFTQFLPSTGFQMLGAAGDCSAPAWSFQSAAGLGIAKVGANGAFCIGGVQVGLWSSSLFNFLQPAYATEFHPGNGYNGTKTAGSCTFTIVDGIITNVTGC